MRLFLLAVLLGLAVGYLRGGRARRLASLAPPKRLALLVWAGAALQLAGVTLPLETAGFDLGLVLVLISYALAGVFLLGWSIALRRTGRLPRALAWGLALCAVGWALNTIAIAANGGMPVSREALRAVGRGEADVSGRALSKHVAIGEDTRLAFLGDVVPTFAEGPVVSLGDLALALGLGTALCAAMTGRRETPAESPFGGSLRPSRQG
jgi:hypothetical protein